MPFFSAGMEFSTHARSNMEIVSILLEGDLATKGKISNTTNSQDAEFLFMEVPVN